MTHEYYDWASTDDLLRHMRDQHGLPLLTLAQLGAAHRDDSVHRAFHKEYHGPACSRCGARPAPNQARSVCDYCDPATPLCQGCYVSHAREALAGAADEQQAVREARLFLASLAELISKLLADGYPDVAAWAEQLAALVREWIAAPSDPALHERVRLAMLEFNELAGGS